VTPPRRRASGAAARGAPPPAVGERGPSRSSRVVSSLATRPSLVARGGEGGGGKRTDHRATAGDAVARCVLLPADAPLSRPPPDGEDERSDFPHAAFPFGDVVLPHRGAWGRQPRRWNRQRGLAVPIRRPAGASKSSAPRPYSPPTAAARARCARARRRGRRAGCW
jgi:hypothetical protein